MSQLFSDESSAREVIKDIIKGKYSDNTAYSLLCQIINDLRGKQIANEARKLKEDMFG